MKPKKIALFGGSFDPIHNHHVKMSNYVLKKNLVDEVWIIPSKNHPFNKKLTHAEDRINMINLACRDPKIKVNRIEIESKETNYTIRTLRKLKAQYSHEFYWMIGADILQDMKEDWHGLPYLLKETEFIIFNRENCPLTPLPNMKIKAILDIETNNEFSTGIRERVREGKSLKNLVPLPVEEYIQKRGLYKE